MRDFCKRDDASYSEQLDGLIFEIDGATRRVKVMKSDLDEDAELTHRDQLREVSESLDQTIQQLDEIWVRLMADRRGVAKEGGQ